MRKMITAALAALTLGGAVLAGVAGLAVGAALADSYGPRYYGGGYYPAPYYYGGPATCYARRDVWDPYMGRYVMERYPYAC